MTLEEIKSRINPIYADTIGTESYERRWLVGEIERLRQQVKELTDYADRKANEENQNVEKK